MSKNHLIPTETLNKRTQNLGTSSPKQIAQMINAEDFNAARAVKKAAISIGKTIQLASETFLAGGKIIFIGAGTSGRLGVLEAAECVPTFGTKPSQIIGIIAGGKKAMFRSQEGAEDDALQGGKDILKEFIKPCSSKIIIHYEVTHRGIVKIYTNRPGIIIGRAGKDIKMLIERFATSKSESSLC